MSSVASPGPRSVNGPERFWLSALGQRVLEAEREILARPVAKLHGESALWVGPDAAAATAMARQMIKLPVFLPSHCPTGGPQDASDLDLPSIDASLEELPFGSRALDAIVLHHALEQAQDPRLVLREAARVLAPGGHLLLSVFNPWSLLGARRLYAKALPDPLKGLRFLSPIKLFDWLTLLGLELNAPPVYAGLGFMGPGRLVPTRVPLGGVLVVSAVNQASNFRLRWQPPRRRRGLAPVAYPTVANWNRHPD